MDFWLQQRQCMVRGDDPGQAASCSRSSTGATIYIYAKSLSTGKAPEIDPWRAEWSEWCQGSRASSMWQLFFNFFVFPHNQGACLKSRSSSQRLSKALSQAAPAAFSCLVPSVNHCQSGLGNLMSRCPNCLNHHSYFRPNSGRRMTSAKEST